MKIEKVNDHQIRCTLTGADLANRELKISELAYGSEKAKTLFRDMMQQANFEFGFEAEDIPLMIEAIPVSADCIVLIITKVEDPDEIDTRFSNFAPQAADEEDDDDGIAFPSDIADDVLDLFQKIRNSAQSQMQQIAAKQAASKEEDTEEIIFPRALVCESLPHLCSFARQVDSFYDSPNTLYKNPSGQSYHLLLTSDGIDAQAFGRVLNIATEYGQIEKVGAPKQAFMEEHYPVIIEDSAIRSLAQI